MGQSAPDTRETFSIGMAARLAGLSRHRIRKWEQRYSAVTPSRSASNRRRFSRSDVARLGMLRELTDRGHRIGDVARLGEARLRALIDEVSDIPSSRAEAEREGDDRFERFRQDYLAAISSFDLRRSADLLARAATLVSFEDFVYRVVLPILREAGQRWLTGNLTVAQEHLVSNQLRSLLASRLHWPPGRPDATRVLVATPEGHQHEFGVLVGALLAARHGLEPIYLGPSLPGGELLDAAEDGRAGLVLLAVERDCDDAELDALAETLRRLSIRVATWVGLPEGHALRERATGARYLTSFEALDAALADAVAVGAL